MSVATRRRSSLLPHDIPYRPPAEYPKLNLPRTEGKPPNTPFQPYTQYHGRHFNFRLTSEPWLHKASSQLQKRCEVDLNAINLAFPNLRSINIILCMAAWLSVLCTFDDLVEQLDSSQVRKCLLESVSIMREGHVFLDPSFVQGDDMSHCFTDKDTRARIRHLSHAFRSHVQAMLPERVYWRFCDGICSTWLGIIGETQLRAQGTKPRIATYMEVRTRAVGLAPFVTLLESCALPETHVKSEALKSLEKNVGTIVGLQNDLIGLEKDLRGAEAMNFIVIASDVPVKGAPAGQGLWLAQDGIVRAVTWHNHAVEMAKKHLKTVMSNKKNGGEKEVANELFKFIATHYYWRLRRRGPGSSSC